MSHTQFEEILTNGKTWIKQNKYKEEKSKKAGHSQQHTNKINVQKNKNRLEERQSEV